MAVHELAGKPAPRSLLANIPRLVSAYFTDHPDANCPAEKVAFGKRGEKLEAILEDVRLKGYAFNDDNWVPGLQAVSAPVFNGQGEVEASLNVCFISQMVRFDEMIGKFVPPLMDTARKISAVLGFDRGPRFGR
ncbi:MAG: hypothetical protein L7F78_13255 [Syntrophales bacterium LBB04]|nr:hypothetical protein [Syntrophales bacterium LBB04]